MKGVHMLKIGTVYRMPKEHQPERAIVDGLPNYYFETNTPEYGFDFQKGIHKAKEVEINKIEKRCPLIIISSTPRKAGSEDTPWHDRYVPDHGYVKYYGDNKYGSGKPEEAPGNKKLLSLLNYYNSNDEKVRLEKAIPIIFFERCSYDGRPKGNAIFQGFGILESVELVTQYDHNSKGYFSNYLFTFCVLSLADNNEQFDWRWISDRCNGLLLTKETMKFAPKSWKTWIKEGNTKLNLIRRTISSLGLVKKNEQKTDNPQLLKEIYEYYGGKSRNSDKHEFEFLALEITLKVIEENGAKCKPGWITKSSGDGGVDFVLRVDLGRDKLASVRVIVLGQAKCNDPTKPVNGRDIARTVARLKRGWIGAFVTTSFFSEAVQQEVKEDDYPIMMINGAKITEIVERELKTQNISLKAYLAALTTKYSRLSRIPEDILE